MIHVRSLDDLQLNHAWVTIGMFDGVHKGHRAIIEPMATGAQMAGNPSVVVTFYPAPAVVLRGNGGGQYLTLPEERAELLGNLGISAVVTLEFTRELAQKTPEEFIRQMADRLGLERLWVGYDFALGKNRSGTLPVLQDLGHRYGYEVKVVSPVETDGAAISSSRIRALLSEGNIRKLTNMLGRWYSLSGLVVHGDGRGSKMGFATANLQVSEEKLLPPNGVYACWVWVEGNCLPAVVNIGMRPTFASEAPVKRIEVHVLDFKQDIYDKVVRLEFADFIRLEKRFKSPEALAEQVQRDIKKARNVLVQFDLESGG